jgi:hypothetical protein
VALRFPPQSKMFTGQCHFETRVSDPCRSRTG